MSAPFLKLTDVSAAYDKKPIIEQINFDLAEGELACLLGPSGCGKTTILRAISGFQSLLSGQIELDGKILANLKTNVLPEHRNIGMVFQDHALFPHLSIADNIGFGLRKHNSKERAETVKRMLDLIDMPNYQDRFPHELSGGQSQRVALARAIAPQPKLLLLDEPFSNLDTDLRESLGNDVRDLLKELEITAIMVTHDQHDAFALGEKIGVISDGKLLQWDSSFNLYHAPASRFIANFIGDGVLVKGKMTKENTVITSFGEIYGQIVNKPLIDTNVDLLIRPDDVSHDPQSSIRGKVTRKAFKGAQTLYTLCLENGEELMSLVPSHDDYEIDDIIGVSIKPDHLVCFKS